MLILFLSLAAAATLNVDAGGSTSYSTIQSAVNAASNGDTIKVKPGTYVENVDTKGKNLTIKATGSSSNTSIDGKNGDHSVTVDQGETITLTGFTLTGGDAGMEVRGSTVVASDIVVKDVSGGAPGGGFLVADGADLTISDCSVDGVSIQNSQYGGGFFIEESTASITDCSVTNNTAYQGGGFYIWDSTVSLTDVKVDGNTADWKGGGLRIRENSEVTGTRLWADNNSSGDLGGGINTDNSDITCTGCKVRWNHAGGSGGGMSISGDNGGGVVMNGSGTVINGNTTDQAAGGIYSTQADLTLYGTMSNNRSKASSDTRGEGIYFTRGKLTLRSLTMSGHASTEGGAVWVGSGNGESLVVDQSTFSGNSATGDGGAIFTGAPVTITDSTFDSNEAGSAGGAIFVDEVDMTADRCSFTGNTATQQGGAINVYKAGLTLRTSDLVGNEATNGGAVYFHGAGDEGAKAVLNKNSFDSNVASNKGGAVNSNGGKSWNSTNSTYSANSPEGVHVTGATWVLVKNDTYRDNTGDGMVMSTISNGRTESSRFIGNGGDGAYFSASKNHLVVACTFIENSGAGITLAVSDTGMRVENCDAVANDTGFAVEYGTGDTLVNNIAAYNDKDGIAAVSATPTVEYNDSSGNGSSNWGGSLANLAGTDGNISQDPEYTGFSDDNNGLNDILFLGSTSPCRDAGDPSMQDGDGSRSDMGSFGGAYATDEDSDGDGYKPSDGDCDNSDADVHPGATDTWYDGVDSDCDGQDDYDKDGDGYRDPSGAGQDCDDDDPDINPGAEDSTEDGIDQDCDGKDGGTVIVDDTGVETGLDTEDTGDPTTDTGWWVDQDGDGYSPSQGDCDDDDIRVNPLAAETCDDEVDNDCDGAVDDADGECIGSASCAPGCASTGFGGLGGLAGLLLAAGLVIRSRRGPSSP